MQKIRGAKFPRRGIIAIAKIRRKQKEKWHITITNAETESLNRTIRDLDKDGRGYSFDVLRDKVVLKHLIPRRTGKFEF